MQVQLEPKSKNFILWEEKKSNNSFLVANKIKSGKEVHMKYLKKN